MNDKDQCQAAFLATNSEYCRTDERWMGWQQAWSHLSAELAALGSQAGHDAAQAVHYRKKYEQAEADLAASREREARLREALEVANRALWNIAMSATRSMAWSTEKDGNGVSVHEWYRDVANNVSITIDAALSQSSAPASVPAVSETATELTLRDFGYAPGGYMTRCRTCREVATNQDKRSWNCKACAQKALDVARLAREPDYSYLKPEEIAPPKRTDIYRED